MGPNAKYRAVFKRMETDEELRARILDRIGRSAYKTAWVNSLIGPGLDEEAWFHCQMQRRIVEDVA